MPTQEDDLLWITKTMGFASVADFNLELDKHRELVAKEFDTLLGQNRQDDNNGTEQISRSKSESGFIPGASFEGRDIDALIVELPDALKEAGIKFNEIQVYDTSLQPQKIKTAVDAILFFSPSGVESYLKENKIGDKKCFCIGTTTAEPLKEITENIIIAKQQTVENVIIQTINYYSNKL